MGYKTLNLSNYTWDYADNYEDFVVNQNKQYPFVKANNIHPMGFRGKCKDTDLPSFHPYWSMMVSFGRINRIIELRNQIDVLNVQIIMTDDIKKIDGLEDMIGNIRDSISKCIVHLNKFKISAK